MKIKYIAWKQVIASDVLRLIYGIQGEGLHNQGDQAIQNFGTINENPGLWTGFTNGLPIPMKKEVERKNKENNTNLPITFDIELKNSNNPLKLWQDKNNGRGNPIKINHEIWDRNSGHETAIINIWYLGYVRLLSRLLERLIERDGRIESYLALKDFVNHRLSDITSIEQDLYEWIKDTQDGFCALEINTNFLRNDNIKDIKKFIEDNYYLVMKCEDKGEEFNLALMANSKSSVLHNGIKSLLQETAGQVSKCGGREVNMVMEYSVMTKDAQEILNNLFAHKNVILYGPPGTGKTRVLLEVQTAFENGVIYNEFDTEAPFRIVPNEGNDVEKNVTKWCTFHPNYTYENFVFGLMPKVIDKRLTYISRVGPMLEQCIESNKGKKALLIIDEINRANTGDVFGDTIAFLDSEFNGKLEFPQEFMYDSETYRYVEKPSSLYILSTMNSLDKSVNPLPLELKNKFYIKEFLPDVDVLRDALGKNINISDDVREYCCLLMENINFRIRECCGKEYQMGQGYFWSLVNNTDIETEKEVLADIIKSKVFPHLKEIVPNDAIPDFFGSANQGVLYNRNSLGYDFCQLGDRSATYVINAFSSLIGSNISLVDSGPDEIRDLEAYNEALISSVYTKLKKYHNIILSGVSGTGKSFIINEVAKKYFDDNGVSRMYWHSSTEYSDVIEGICSKVVGNEIDYSIEAGRVKKLAETDFSGDKLMIIEGINRSNTAENFGELITLLEADKRSLNIRGLDGFITLPSNMYLICTLNPNAENQYKLDSALKRRFYIIDVKPDYKLLYLKYNLELKDSVELDMEDLYEFSTQKIQETAIVLLECLNNSIGLCLGDEYQIGHSVLCGLPKVCSVSDILEVYDTKVFPYLEEYCRDENVANIIFGDNSPLVKKCANFVEALPFWYLAKECDDETMLKTKVIDAFKGLLRNGINRL